MPDDNNDRGGWSALAEGWAIAFLFPASIAAGFGLGYAGDWFFHTSPWLKIAGTVLGVAAAFINLFKVASSGDKDR